MILNSPRACSVAGLSQSFARMEKDKGWVPFCSEVGPVWNTTASTMKKNSRYLEEKFSNISADEKGFHCPYSKAPPLEF